MINEHEEIVNEKIEITEKDIISMSERLTQLKINIKIKEEENKKILNEISNLISSLDENTLDTLIKICPEATIFRTLTIQDIMQDTDNISDKIHSVLVKLFAFLEEQLRYFEELI